MRNIVYKKLSLSKICYTILVALLYMNLLNCSLSKSHVEGPKQRLVCFDFRTMVEQNLRYELLRASPCDDSSEGMLDEKAIGEAIVDVTKSLLNNGKLTFCAPNTLKKLMNDLLIKGHKIAITTFIDHPGPIEACLEKLGLNENQVKNISIIIGLPTMGPQGSIIGHINIAKELTGIKDNAHVVVVTGTTVDIDSARRCRLPVVPAGDNFSWYYVQEKVASLTKNE